MKFIDKNKPILVTGGTGYIASWIIKYLLEDGYIVNTTVRNLADESKYSHLKKLHPTNLHFFEADLLNANSFLEAMKDVELVIHTASPFVVRGIKDPNKELVEPAKLGTENVLNSVNLTKTVKKVVLTSSVAAIYGDNKEITNTKDHIFTEEYWNRTSSLVKNPYSYSKTVAEETAWKFAKSQSRWDLVVINPAFVLGPYLSKRTDSTSVQTMIQLGNGTYRFGVPELFFGITDVRDVAKAHIIAGTKKEATGRHILCNECLELLEMSLILKKYFPEKPLPTNKIPYFLIWLLSPILGFPRAYVEENIGIKIRFDNSYTKKDLGMNFISVEQTLKEHFGQLIEDGILK